MQEERARTTVVSLAKFDRIGSELAWTALATASRQSADPSSAAIANHSGLTAAAGEFEVEAEGLPQLRVAEAALVASAWQIAAKPPDTDGMQRLARAEAAFRAQVARLLDEQSVKGQWARTWTINALLIAVLAAAGGLVATFTIALSDMQDRADASAELARARSSVSWAQRTRLQFFQALGHDLRQPMQALSMFAAAIERRVEDPLLAPMLAGLRSSLSSLRRMLGGLLDVARLDAGAYELNPSNVALHDLLAPIRTEFGEMAAAKNLAFTVDEADGIYIRTDRVMFECILRNLVSNAVRYTSAGQVEVIVDILDNQVRVDVRDTGAGIAEDDLERIFLEFYRSPSAVRQADGLGLGLSIVSRLADLLEGTAVSVVSILGQGTTFAVTAPLGKAPAFEPELVAVDDLGPEISLAGASVLLVEDDAAVRQSLASELSAHGMSVTATDGPAATLALFERGDAVHFDVALVDRDLKADLTGPELLDRLAADYGLFMPAVILSGTSDFAVIEALQDGDYPWLSKPVDIRILMGELARQCAAVQQTAEAAR